MKRIYWMISLLLILSVVLAACGGSDEPATAVAEPAAQGETAVAEEQVNTQEKPTVPPTALSEPTAVPTVETPEETAVAFKDLQLLQLEELSSYRYEMVMEIVGTLADSTVVTQTMVMNLAVSADPPATSMVMTAEGMTGMEEFGSMEFVQIGDTSYIVIPEMGCMALPVSEDNPMSTAELADSFSPESITEDLDKVTFVGEDTINGIAVLHYTFDETSLAAEEAAGVETAEGHLYVAKVGGFLVRSIMTVTGSSTFAADLGEDAPFKTATTFIEMNLMDVNEAVNIEPPAACEGQSVAGSPDWPMLDDASEIVSFGGIVSYLTAVSGQEAIDFYHGEMAELGWTFDEAASFVMDGTGFLNYTNEDGESLNITIAEDADTGLTSVTLLTGGDF